LVLPGLAAWIGTARMAVLKSALLATLLPPRVVVGGAFTPSIWRSYW